MMTVRQIPQITTLQDRTWMSVDSKTTVAILTAALVVALAPSWAVAQSSSDKSPGGKRTTVDFEDQLVEGQAQKPELFYLLQQRNNNFKRLIILRENFLPEMRKGAEDITRKGSGN